MTVHLKSERSLLATAHMRRIMIHDIIDIQLNNSSTGLIQVLRPGSLKIENQKLFGGLI